MENALYLTAEEREAFAALSSQLQEGWKVLDAAPVPEDNPPRQAIRMQMIRLKDPHLKAFVERAKQCESQTDLVAHLATLKPANLLHGDLAELFFAVGPQTLSALVLHLFSQVKTDEDLQDIEALTVIRTALSEARTS